MTICNMTIEGGGRAGMIAPDDTTFEWIEGRPGAPEDFEAAVDALARAAHRRRRDASTRRSRVDAARALAARHLGHDARRWSSPVTERGARAARPTATSARWSTWASRPARRCRRSGSTASSSARARTAASATCAPPPRWSRAARSPATSTRWSCPAPSRCAAQAEAEGLDEVFRAAGFDWRTAGCSMCLGMNPDILAARRALRLDLEPQLRGPPGPRRAHAPRLARRWPPRPPSRATSSTSGSGADGARSSRSRATVSVLDRADVDTDQIIPKQFLKRVERTGFGEFLFYDWAQGARLGPADEPDPRHRAELRLRLVARARPVGARRTTASRRSSRRASPTSSSTTARRSACCRSCCPRTTSAR